MGRRNPSTDWAHFFLVGGIHDVIMHAKFSDDRLRGSWVVWGQNSAFPIDFAGRPYNSHTTVWAWCTLRLSFAYSSVKAHYYYLRRRRLSFHFGLSVYLSVCASDNWKSCERILTKFLGGLAHGPYQRVQFWWRSGLPSLDYGKVTNGFWWNFTESWGVA